MEKLIPFAMGRLRNVELIQFVRDTVADATGSQVSLLVSDAPLAGYLSTLTSAASQYEFAVRNPQKNPFTELLIGKDQTRDLAFSRFGRKLAYFELSAVESEQKAAATLGILWNLHRNNSRLNYQAQTSATDNFLIDLAKEPYASALTALDLSGEVEAVRTTNDEFRAASSDKRAGLAESDFMSAKQLRTSLTTSASAFAGYVDSMALAYTGNAEWEKLVKVMNVVRQRYAEILARRGSTDKTDAQDNSTPAPQP
ncbi:MAG: hypothetical protein BGN96_05330 [Bacteroidales bacterium 45-6]|nr:MAG: hypothetical protein BGN96_05330 [Bacteroidales bacterium 45-6]